MKRNTRVASIGLILLVAILSFEAFNFDTTRFALSSLLGSVAFMGVPWATILAVAFCGIDFAGLLHLFTPDSDRDAPAYVWFLFGAWLCGATINAVLTWYAVSLTILQVNAGNAVLSQDALLTVFPIFVALLVWLTRILFIGALSIMGDALLPLGYTPEPSGFQVIDEEDTTPRIPPPRRVYLRPVQDAPDPPIPAVRPHMNTYDDE